MKTLILNNQTSFRVNLPALRRVTAELAENLARANPDMRWSEVTLLLTDDNGIRQTNREFFGKDRPTDVISFNYDPIPGEDDQASGDLVVNIECAVREGAIREGADAELALYIAHGFDHLSGADDNSPEKRAAMRLTEMNWLDALKSEINQLILT